MEISSQEYSLEINLTNGEKIKTLLYNLSYGFSKNIYKDCKCDEFKIKKSLEKYLSENQGLPLVIEKNKWGSPNIDRFTLIPREKINTINLINNKK